LLLRISTEKAFLLAESDSDITELRISELPPLGIETILSVEKATITGQPF
jgi:hypothetical protein